MSAQTPLEEQLLEKLRQLPLERLAEVKDFVEIPSPAGRRAKACASLLASFGNGLFQSVG